MYIIVYLAFLAVPATISSEPLPDSQLGAQLTPDGVRTPSVVRGLESVSATGQDVAMSMAFSPLFNGVLMDVNGDISRMQSIFVKFNGGYRRKFRKGSLELKLPTI